MNKKGSFSEEKKRKRGQATVWKESLIVGRARRAKCGIDPTNQSGWIFLFTANYRTVTFRVLWFFSLVHLLKVTVSRSSGYKLDDITEFLYTLVINYFDGLNRLHAFLQ